MTEELHETPLFTGSPREALAPEHVAALVAWLVSPRADGITGQIVEVTGERLNVWEGWRPIARASIDGEWTLERLDGVREQLFGSPGATVSSYPDLA
jgi:hypothetical protein